MAYLTATNRSFQTAVDLATARTLIEDFCKQAFPGTRPYRSYNGRISVSVNMGEGAYGSVWVDSRDLTPAEKKLETSPTACRIEIGGTLSGVNVGADAKGRAEMQRFFDDVTKSLQRTLDGFAANGLFRPFLRIRTPQFGDPDLGVA